MKTKFPVQKTCFILLMIWLCLKILTIAVTPLLEPLRLVLHIIFFLLCASWILVLIESAQRKPAAKKSQPARK